ncbi:cyclic phosphodiesterase-like [Pyrus ussuriensis x Pyrus communis]|uniref:Cyclic phosphodiesterase-like n=1 Tax=Pyrus ussuriensis x Pyrus communis TaxID=2448454 RepID=A0A5N5H699_9ROSA|nr:cyclic phosphodiesterase-like [Pyrus ussuriensis x Pyrus communis]
MEVVKTEERQSYSVWAIPPDDVSCRIKKLTGASDLSMAVPTSGPTSPLRSIPWLLGFPIAVLLPSFFIFPKSSGPSALLPHMSLLYGHLTEEQRKKAQEKVYILDESITSLSFPVTHTALYQTNYKDKTLRSWEKIAKYYLHFNN